MADVFLVVSLADGNCRDTGDGNAGVCIAGDHCTCTDGNIGMHHHIVDNAYIGTYIDIVANDGGLGTIAPDGGELSYVYIVADDGVAVDDQSATVLNVESVADAYGGGDEEAIMSFV